MILADAGPTAAPSCGAAVGDQAADEATDGAAGDSIEHTSAAGLTRAGRSLDLDELAACLAARGRWRDRLASLRPV